MQQLQEYGTGNERVGIGVSGGPSKCEINYTYIPEDPNHLFPMFDDEQKPQTKNKNRG